MNETGNLGGYLLQDWKRNAGRPQMQLLLACFRAAQKCRAGSGPVRVLGPLFTLLYRWPALFMVGVDMPVSTKVGPGLAIHHGLGIIVHSRTRIGRNVTLRQNTTIGAKESGSLPPRIGDGVDIGAGALIIGDLEIGAGASVGAGTVVLRDVPEGGVVVGNPGRVLTNQVRNGEAAL
jgi:serine acetyltransferase